MERTCRLIFAVGSCRRISFSNLYFAKPKKGGKNRKFFRSNSKAKNILGRRVENSPAAFTFVLIFCYAWDMQKYTAIILASRDVGEFDRLYIFYTREAGLLRAMGRGVRKQEAKLAGHLEPGTLSEVYIANFSLFREKFRGGGKGRENIRLAFGLAEKFWGNGRARRQMAKLAGSVLVETF